MHEALSSRLDAIRAICERHAVRTLDVFGSAARGVDFDPDRSDVDLIVCFARDDAADPLEQFFGLRDALAASLGRPVDLVEEGAIRNPFIQASIQRSRRPIYGA